MEESFTKTAKDEVSGIHLQYTVISTEDPHISDSDLNKVYSLLVIMTYPDRDYESLFVYDISRNIDRALRIAAVMCEHTVTPCTVYDILDDIL